MAINKSNYLDGEGNYDLKKDLVDELIDGVNTHETKNISSAITTTGLTVSSKNAFKIGDLCFITVAGTATASIPAYTSIVGLTGYTTRFTQYFANISNKSYVIYTADISSRVALAQGEDITFSTILLLN